MNKKQILDKLHSAKNNIDKKFSEMLIGFDNENLLLVYERFNKDNKSNELIIVDCTPNENSGKQYENFEELAKNMDYEKMTFMFTNEIVEKYGTLMEARKKLFSIK